jgi:hypothetical protein
MNKDELTRAELKKVLDGLAKAHTKAFEFRMKLKAHCEAVYGVDPADVDNDQFIDACDGGAGVAEGMTVDEFDESMLDSMKRH